MPSRRYRNKAKSYLSPEDRKGRAVGPPAPYRSWLEADVAEDLKRRKIKFKYENTKVTFVEPSKVRTYLADLDIGDLIVEVKGRWTAQDRKKMMYVIEQNPELDIRILFDKDNTISRNSKTRYSDWCDKREIKYAIGRAVPDDWLGDKNGK